MDTLLARIACVIAKLESDISMDMNMEANKFDLLMMLVWLSVKCISQAERVLRHSGKSCASSLPPVSRGERMLVGFAGRVIGAGCFPTLGRYVAGVVGAVKLECRHSAETDCGYRPVVLFGFSRADGRAGEAREWPNPESSTSGPTGAR